MRPSISRDVVEEIKARLSITDLVEDYVSLKRSGKNFVGLCPFHDDNNPSMQVSEEKGVFHCFSCGAGGDLFGFYMRYNNVSFPEAAAELAKKTGIELAPPTRQKRPPSSTNKLFKINSIAARYYAEALAGAQGSASAREYLDKRGLSPEIISDFGIGFAPGGWDSLAKHLESRNVPMAEAERLGLVTKRKGSEGYYDRFRERVIFPIRDLEARVIGFGGRIISEGEPKYLNSPESPLFHKGRTLYGLDKSRDEIRRTNSVLIVEGYMDYLALYGAGVRNVVATLGTSLTSDHARLLKMYTGKAALLYDSDRAGTSAAIRGLEVFLKKGISPHMVILPEGEDPDSYIAAQGARSLRTLVGSAPPLMDYFIDHTLEQVQTGGASTREAAGTLAEACAAIAEPVERGLYVRKVAEAIGVREGDLLDIINKRMNNETHITVKSGIQSPSRETLILKILLAYPELADALEETDFMEHIFDSNIRMIVDRIVSGGVRDSSALLLDFDDNTDAQELVSFLVLATDDIPDTVSAGDMLMDCIRNIELRGLEERLRVLRLKIGKADGGVSPDLHDSLLREYRDLLEHENTLKGELYEEQG